jgi:hypothetical protein
VIRRHPVQVALNGVLFISPLGETPVRGRSETGADSSRAAYLPHFAVSWIFLGSKFGLGLGRFVSSSSDGISDHRQIDELCTLQQPPSA